MPWTYKIQKQINISTETLSQCKTRTAYQSTRTWKFSFPFEPGNVITADGTFCTGLLHG